MTDCAVSPVDESILFYASITPYVHLARVPQIEYAGLSGRRFNDFGRRTTSGGTQTPHSDSTPHQSLEIGRGFASPGLERDGVFGVWSCRWSSDGTTLLCGTSDAAACVHDRRGDVTVVRHKAHDGDVNAVAWANGGDGATRACTSRARTIAWSRRGTLGRRPGVVPSGCFWVTRRA